MASDPIETIAAALHRVRRDWERQEIAALFCCTAIPRETLLRALALGCRAVGPDGRHILSRPREVLHGAWLVAAQAEVDQLDARDRHLTGSTTRSWLVTSTVPSSICSAQWQATRRSDPS